VIITDLINATGELNHVVAIPVPVAKAGYRYYDLRITTLLIKGFEPTADMMVRLFHQRRERAASIDVAAA
jgi:hypothetical protein